MKTNFVDGNKNGVTSVNLIECVITKIALSKKSRIFVTVKPSCYFVRSLCTELYFLFERSIVSP